MLNLQNERQKNGELTLNHYGMNYLLPGLKRQPEYSWLNEVSHASLQTICGDLNKAFKRFWNKQKRHPKFKSKKTARPCYPVRSTKGNFYFRDGMLQVEGLGKLKYSTNYKLPQGREHKFHNPRIFYNHASKKWMVGFGLDCESQAIERNPESMGIDLGVKDLAIVAYGDEKIVFGNINKEKRIRALKKKLTHVERAISRKRNQYKREHPREEFVASKSLQKYEQMRREIYYKISNIRKNYIHQITRELVDMRPHSVGMEDLSVRDMQKNKHLSKVVGEQNFSMFIE